MERGSKPLDTADYLKELMSSFCNVHKIQKLMFTLLNMSAILGSQVKSLRP